MMELLLYGASGLGGAILVFGGVYVSQRGENRRAAIAHEGENERARKAAEQRLRDVKSERLRRLYEPLVKFSIVLTQIAKEKSYTMEGEPQEARDERHQRELRAGMSAVSVVITSVVIEPGTEKVLGAYNAAFGAADKYLRTLNLLAKAPGTMTLDEINHQFDEITGSADRLAETVRGQLAELEKPL